MKIITIAGNIGKDAELRTTGKGDKVAGFNVAVSEGRDSETTWFSCSLWGNRGEKLAQYLTKGSKVTVTGALTIREKDGKTYLGCRVSEIALQGRSDNSGNSNRREEESRSQGGYGGSSNDLDLDDDIPF